MIKHIGESTTASATYAGFSERNLEEVSQGSIVVLVRLLIPLYLDEVDVQMVLRLYDKQL